MWAPAADFKRKGGAGVSAPTVGNVAAHVLKQVHMHLVHADCEAPRRATIGRYGAVRVAWPLSAIVLDDSRDTIIVQRPACASASPLPAAVLDSSQNAGRCDITERSGELGGSGESRYLHGSRTTAYRFASPLLCRCSSCPYSRWCTVSSGRGAADEPQRMGESAEKNGEAVGAVEGSDLNGPGCNVVT